MKKITLALSGLTLAMLGGAAFAQPNPNGPMPRKAGPGVPPPPPHVQRERKRIPEKAPEEIKNAYREMRSLRHDLNLELRKDSPDSAKALEMLRKSEELHARVREWEVRQILAGEAPKPGPNGPRPEPRGSRPCPNGPRPGFGSDCSSYRYRGCGCTMPMWPTMQHGMMPIMPNPVQPPAPAPQVQIGQPAPAPQAPQAGQPAQMMQPMAGPIPAPQMPQAEPQAPAQQ